MKKAFSFIVSVVLCILFYQSYSVPVIAEDGASDKIISRKSYYTDEEEWITTITRYASGIVHFDVSLNGSVEGYRYINSVYEIRVFNSYILDNAVVENKLIDKFFEKPTVFYADDYVNYKWSYFEDNYYIKNEVILSFDLLISDEYTDDTLNIGISDGDGYLEIGISAKTPDDSIIGLQARIDDLKAVVEHKDAQIETLNETVDALRSQIEFITKTQPVCGDTDGDGRVSISDSIILNRYLAGTVDSLPCSDPPHIDDD